ncbi:hypothetical protein KCV00_g330, partial [Aureobasidium melanogenum]
MRQWRKYLGKVFARRILRHGVHIVRELTGRAGLTGAKWIELAWHMRRVCKHMSDMRGPKSSTGHTLCFGRTAGTGEGCGRVWLGKVPRHVLSKRGAARAPVRRVFFDTHGQIASQHRAISAGIHLCSTSWQNCDSGECSVIAWTDCVLAGSSRRSEVEGSHDSCLNHHERSVNMSPDCLAYSIVQQSLFFNSRAIDFQPD